MNTALLMGFNGLSTYWRDEFVSTYHLVPV
jgi:predicted acetyltransferase